MERIVDYANKLTELSPEEADALAASFQLIHVKKKQFLVQPDFVAGYRYFVIEGAFRAFVVCHQGQEHTISMAIEDWWITDYNSYVYQQPATMFVAALENSTVLRLSFENEQKLKAGNHNLERLFRIMAEQGLAAHQRRITNNLTLSAEKRLGDFEVNYPQMVKRLPQYVIASYLGFTPEFYSRLRKKAVSNKS